MFLSSAHDHTTYGDGRSSVREMVEAALRSGFGSLGFSEHLEFVGSGCSIRPDQVEAYRAEVRALGEEHAGQIRVWLGVERDSLADLDPGPVDYAIGSVHYIEKDGALIVVDGNGDKLAEDVRTHFGGDGIAYARWYYDALTAYICSFRPQIIGHLDLVRKWNARWNFFDTEDPTYRRPVLDALDAMSASGALLEVNTGGMARGYLPTPYPELFALRFWRERGGQVIIGTDCHDAAKIAYGMEEARQLCLAAGYREILALGTGTELFEAHGL